jgi:hypothetical protein
MTSMRPYKSELQPAPSGLASCEILNIVGPYLIFCYMVPFLYVFHFLFFLFFSSPCLVTFLKVTYACMNRLSQWVNKVLLSIFFTRTIRLLFVVVDLVLSCIICLSPPYTHLATCLVVSTTLVPSSPIRPQFGSFLFERNFDHF